MSQKKPYNAVNVAVSLFASLSVQFAQMLPAFAAAARQDNLNLASIHKTITATQTASIVYGGQRHTILPGMALTPAEAMALSQVLQTGHQSLIVGARGNAIGGTAILPAVSSVSSLVIPRAVTVLGNFSTGGQLALTGDIVNSGRLFGVYNNVSFNKAYFSAYDITNNRGGLISTVVPQGGFAGFANAINNLSLTLEVAHAITNRGTISSAADLSLIGAGPNLLVNNKGGIVSAPNGVLSVQSTNATANSVLNLVGGQILSPQVNVDAGAGRANINVDVLPGVLSTIAGSEFVAVWKSDLNLGQQKIAGDPTFVSGGNISINALPGQAGNETFTQDVTILAAGNVNFSNGDHLIANDGTQGKNITIVAGANIVPTPSSPSQLSPTQSVTVSGPSTLGGNIRCPGCTSFTVDTSATASGAAGGKITLVAFNAKGSVPGAPPNNGQIDVSAGTLNTSSSSGTAGSVSLLAPNNITVETINASGSKGGNVTITGAIPAGKIVALANGAVTGAFTAGKTPNHGSNSISIGMLDHTSSIDVHSTGAGVAGGNVTFVTAADTDIDVAGTINANGGPGQNATVPGQAGIAGGNGGRIIANSKGGDVVTADVGLTITAIGGNGGDGANGSNGSGGHRAGFNGGAGGAGGKGGSLLVTAEFINLVDGTLFDLHGGTGGNGKAGGNGLPLTTQSGIAGAGGAGGAAGNAGSGGIATFKCTNTIGGGGITVRQST